MRLLIILVISVFSVGAFAYPSDVASLNSNPCIDGICHFRGNSSRTFHGTGDFTTTTAPEILWRYPENGILEGISRVGGKDKVWAGNGWTGQPAVQPYCKEWRDGIAIEWIPNIKAYIEIFCKPGKKSYEVIVGAYDKAVHFLDLYTGQPTRPKYQTNDIIKGSVSIDPDGFPFLYFGSRDNYYRILRLDRVTDLSKKWDDKLDLALKHNGRVPNRVWNDDWDGNGMIVDDLLYIGGENSRFYIFKLNREWLIEDKKAVAKINPENLIDIPGYTQELIEDIGSREVSIENSPVVAGNRTYFANSGGRVVGLDTTNVLQGEAPIVFDFWAGDDIDATLVLDEEHMLYAAVEFEVDRPKALERKLEVGQLIKLDPNNAENPIVWNLDLVPDKTKKDGVWATPALLSSEINGTQYLYVPTHLGRLVGVNTDTGKIVWETNIGWHAWSSPNIIYKDDKANLIIANCTGKVRNYDLTNPEEPNLLWEIQVGSGCIESTPAIWDSMMIFGSRDGRFYGVGFQ